MKRIATRLKKEAMTTMANWPEEKCSEMPPRIQGLVSVKRRKRRVINISRKFHADLSNGIIKFFPKKKAVIAEEPEFQIDLAKATVMYDDKRIVLILKVANEVHSLIPLEDTLDRWKDAIFKHRLYRQEAVKKGLQPDTNHTLETISVTAQRADFGEDKGWESHSCNKMFDEVHQMQGLALEVLEKLTKTYEEMKKTNEDLKGSMKSIRAQPTTAAPAAVRNLSRLRDLKPILKTEPSWEVPSSMGKALPFLSDKQSAILTSDALLRPSEATTPWTTFTSSMSPSNISSMQRSSSFPQSTTVNSTAQSSVDGTSISDSKPEGSNSDDDEEEDMNHKRKKSRRKD